jgi:hypothetical protein
MKCHTALLCRSRKKAKKDKTDILHAYGSEQFNYGEKVENTGWLMCKIIFLVNCVAACTTSGVSFLYI